MLKADWVIVGTGLTGAVLAERLASEGGAKVIVLDRRRHIAGNAHDRYNEHGILVHEFGPHIFHTNSAEVWNYLSQFTAWRPYEHRVLASVEGQLVPVPFNLISLEMLWPRRLAWRTESRLVREFGLGARAPVLRLLEHADPELRAFGKYVYEAVFENYTKKQWGLSPLELDPSVTARVPVLISRDSRYFQDVYQAIPALGYTAMVERMLAAPGIRLLLNTDFREVRDEIGQAGLIFTGAIDEFFGRRFGALPYRSLRFETETRKEQAAQPVAQVNYPGAGSYTRVTEFKHLTGQKAEVTTLAYEYPQEHLPDRTEPFYPVPRAENRALYDRYSAEARAVCPGVHFAGRLGDYRYYNMDQAVARALAVYRQIRSQHRRAA
jgi:UDP-galactopyranose mutase